MKPVVRISLGIVALSTSLLLIADMMFKIFPDPNVPILEGRQDLSETLAIQYTSMVNADQLQQMRPAMESLVAQRDDVLSLSMRTPQGKEIAGTADHDTLWQRTSETRSTPVQVQVPVFHGADRWGTLEIRFENLPTAGLAGLLNTPLYKLIIIMAAGGFFAYLFYMSRTLRYLDPSSVVPDRVRSALDQLAEGVFILDADQHIVMVNNAFARNLGRPSDDLIGIDPGSLDWLDDDGASTQPDTLPWSMAMRDGTRRTDVRLKLKSPTRGTRIFSCNVSPITDDNGKRRGVLASLDDISAIEKANEELRNTLDELESAHKQVRKKNQELFKLATTDPLTGCLNRRSFLEKIESELKIAQRDDLALSVVMADIDHFKSINDNYGHATGDIVIRDIAQVLFDSLGPNDCVGRLGGEEFCLVLVAADERSALETANRARHEFEQRSLLGTSATGGRKITASFGVSSCTFGARDVAELLDQADQALYRSKHQGRNRVTSWTELDASRLAVS